MIMYKVSSRHIKRTVELLFSWRVKKISK